MTGTWLMAEDIAFEFIVLAEAEIERLKLQAEQPLLLDRQVRQIALRVAELERLLRYAREIAFDR